MSIPEKEAHTAKLKLELVNAKLSISKRIKEILFGTRVESHDLEEIKRLRAEDALIDAKIDRIK